MSCTLTEPRVAHVLEQMHADADRNDPPLLARARGKGGAERAALLAEAFIPVSQEAGRLLYALACAATPGTIIEFGTSFGLSTIYLAAAVKDRGAGTVITTEIYESKADRAREYIREAGLLDVVDLRLGDALETLAGVDRDVSFVFLDGMKDLYLPVLRMLEPALRPGALVVADDLDLFPQPLKPYLDYVRDASNGYVSVTVPIGDAMELSARPGDAP
jgi:predicted O-methyltransferase YrrM